jgi:hypothetical protein
VRQKGSQVIHKFKNLKCLPEVKICETFHIGVFFSDLLLINALNPEKHVVPEFSFFYAHLGFV